MAAIGAALLPFDVSQASVQVTETPSGMPWREGPITLNGPMDLQLLPAGTTRDFIESASTIGYEEPADRAASTWTYTYQMCRDGRVIHLRAFSVPMPIGFYAVRFIRQDYRLEVQRLWSEGSAEPGCKPTADWVTAHDESLFPLVLGDFGPETGEPSSVVCRTVPSPETI